MGEFSLEGFLPEMLKAVKRCIFNPNNDDVYLDTTNHCVG